MNFFELEDTASYRQWVNSKQAGYEKRFKDGFALIQPIEADGTIPDHVSAIIRQQLLDYNFALYQLTGDVEDHTASLKNIGCQLGLKELDKNLCAQEDRLTRLTLENQGRATMYIPYTNKAIGWHTDGYYNPQHQRVLALLLHCEHSSESGGENDILDPEMAYIHLRNENPDFIKALSQPQVMCIPENIENGIEIRPETCTAVFMQEQDQSLAMRFSKRKHNIRWADDSVTQEALACLFEFLESDSPYHVKYRLNPGEGLISNNVLHTRTAFMDSPENKRVYYRARYYNRINF